VPVYCYKCFDCEHYAEIKQSFTDNPLSECPECGGDFRRVIRDIGVIFKGSGFHTTDYKSSRKSTVTKTTETPKTTETTETTETTPTTSSTEVKTEDI
jgi:putative FmdB family regulatory protein